MDSFTKIIKHLLYSSVNTGNRAVKEKHIDATEDTLKVQDDVLNHRSSFSNQVSRKSKLFQIGSEQSPRACPVHETLVVLAISSRWRALMEASNQSSIPATSRLSRALSKPIHDDRIEVVSLIISLHLAP